MRIAFVGKGGSGKTTLAALTARSLAAHELPVLAIDADINQHFAGTIGMPTHLASQLPPMGIEIERIKDHLRGTNARIHSAAVMIKTTPPGNGSQLIRFNEQNPLFDYFERVYEGIRVMAVGAFTEEDLGIKCYHSKVGAVELLLNHLIDKKREYVVVDMTAGADSFASGMFTKFDLTLLVVEPTLKSVGVYEQYRSYAKKYGINIRVIGNKIEDAKDVGFLDKHIGEDLIACVRRSDYIRGMEKGDYFPVDRLESENQAAVKTIITALDSSKKDWRKFYEHAVHFHQRNAESWANDEVGENLAAQVDPLFDIEVAVSS